MTHYRTSVQPRRRMNPRHTAAAHHLAETYAAYGRQADPRRDGLGDFFNDVMGTVVPGWDSRPEWMKKIVVKPDAAKIAQAAQKIVSPKQAGAAVDAASRAGVNLFYSTPGGQVPITGAGVANAYQYGPGFMNFGQAVSDIPIWVYGVGGLALIMLLMKR